MAKHSVHDTSAFSIPNFSYRLMARLPLKTMRVIFLAPRLRATSSAQPMRALPTPRPRATPDTATCSMYTSPSATGWRQHSMGKSSWLGSPLTASVINPRASPLSSTARAVRATFSSGYWRNVPSISSRVVGQGQHPKSHLFANPSWKMGRRSLTRCLHRGSTRAMVCAAGGAVIACAIAAGGQVGSLPSSGSYPIVSNPRNQAQVSPASSRVFFGPTLAGDSSMEDAVQKYQVAKISLLTDPARDPGPPPGGAAACRDVAPGSAFEGVAPAWHAMAGEEAAAAAPAPRRSSTLVRRQPADDLLDHLSVVVPLRIRAPMRRPVPSARRAQFPSRDVEFCRPHAQAQQRRGGSSPMLAEGGVCLERKLIEEFAAAGDPEEARRHHVAGVGHHCPEAPRPWLCEDQGGVHEVREIRKLVGGLDDHLRAGVAPPEVRRQCLPLRLACPRGSPVAYLVTHEDCAVGLRVGNGVIVREGHTPVLRVLQHCIIVAPVMHRHVVRPERWDPLAVVLGPRLHGAPSLQCDGRLERAPHGGRLQHDESMRIIPHLVLAAIPARLTQHLAQLGARTSIRRLGLPWQVVDPPRVPLLRRGEAARERCPRRESHQPPNPVPHRRPPAWRYASSPPSRWGAARDRVPAVGAQP
mmetsp:Transcript_6168/g.21089  ORF Transcript_6168/g.21089 Transcript_6168/m.21089 type:complete len:640 (+) Transcript_6168:3047-4966(+)